jgi:hypothetical protein
VQHILDLLEPTSVAAPSIIPDTVAPQPEFVPALAGLRMATG